MTDGENTTTDDGAAAGTSDGTAGEPTDGAGADAGDGVSGSDDGADETIVVSIADVVAKFASDDEVVIELTGTGLDDSTAFTAVLTFDGDADNALKVDDTGTGFTLTGNDAALFASASSVTVIVQVDGSSSAEFSLKTAS